MTKELAGKTAFVTGSGRGLGRVMAERLAELGADVAIHDIDWTAPAKYGEAQDLDAVAKEIARHGGRVCAVSGNIGDKAAVAKMKATIDDEARHRPHPGQLRGRRHRRVGRQAQPEQRARHLVRGHQGADRQQPDRHDAGLPGLRAGDEGRRVGLGRQHRLGRRAYRRNRRRSSIPR